MNMTAIAIIAIIAWALVSIVDSRKMKKTDNKRFAEKDKMEKEIAGLRERIEVLEKIVTDENYDLKRQFEDLEKDKVA